MKLNTTILLLLLFAFFSCKENYTPKPKGYMRIDFPKKSYIEYKSDCSFSFKIPNYSFIDKRKDSVNPCWINILFPKYKATLYISYERINNKSDLNNFLEDNRKFLNRHISKANGIEEELINDTINRKFGIIYNIEGNVASSCQFFVTDSNLHFIRGSLYFYAKPNIDSLLPVVNFIKEDISYLVKTIKWK